MPHSRARSGSSGSCSIAALHPASGLPAFRRRAGRSGRTTRPLGGNAAVHITGPLVATIGYLPAAQSSAEQSRFQICPPVGVGIGSDDAFVRISHWLGVPPAMGVRRALQHREVHGLPGPPAQQSRSMIRPLPPAQQRRQATAGSHSIRAGSVPHDRGPGRRRRRLLALAQLREQG